MSIRSSLPKTPKFNKASVPAPKISNKPSIPTVKLLDPTAEKLLLDYIEYLSGVLYEEANAAATKEQATTILPN